MTEEENKAQHSQETLLAAINEILGFPPDASTEIFAAYGLELARKAASDEMLEEFMKQGMPISEYIKGTESQIQCLFRNVTEYEAHQARQKHMDKKIKRHLVN